MPANNSGIQNIPPEKGTQFAKRSILLIFGNLIKLAVQLAVIYIYSRHLSVEAYGRYQSVWLYINVFSVIGLFGLPSLLLSSSTHEIIAWLQKNKRSVGFFFSVLLIGPIAWIICMNKQFGLNERLLLCSFIILQNISIIAETLNIKKEKETRVLAVNVLYNLLYLGIHLWILQQNQFSLVSLLICLNVLVVLKAVLLFLKRDQLIAGNAGEHVENAGRQWLYLGLYDVVAVLFKWVDKWMILVFISIADFAVYYNGSYEIPVFVMLASAVGNIVVVEFAKSKTVNASAAIHLFRRSSLFLSSLILPAFCFLLFFYREFFVFIFSDKYEAAIPVFFVSIFVIPVRMINHTGALQVYHKNDIIFKGALIDLILALLFLVLLYPTFGLPGVAAAFVVSNYFQGAYYLFHTSRLLKVPMFRLHPFKKLLYIFLVSVVILGVAWFLCNGLTAFYSLAVGLVITTILTGSFFLYFYRNKVFS